MSSGEIIQCVTAFSLQNCAAGADETASKGRIWLNVDTIALQMPAASQNLPSH
jgi:hypothetical protein